MKNTLPIAFLLACTMACSPTQKCVENIKPDCICTMQYDPVCGCNNKTYGNACAAECAGIKTYTKGACPQQATVELENKTWQLKSFAGTEPQMVPDNLNITLKLESGKVSGNGGCNNIGGAYIHDGNTLTVSGLFSTKMYCQEGSPWETKFLQRLEKSQTYSIDNETLTIDCGTLGQLVFRQKKERR